MRGKIGSKEIQEKMKEVKAEKEALISDFIGKNNVLGNYLKLVPRVYRVRMYELFNGSKSRSLAVKMKCYDCAGYNRDEVYNCTVITCPLHNFRPKGGKSEK